MEKLAQGFNTAAEDSNLGPLSRESEALRVGGFIPVLVTRSRIGRFCSLYVVIVESVCLVSEQTEVNSSMQ